MNTARPVAPSVRRRIWERDGGICQMCFQPVAFDRLMHIDHIAPVSIGGCSHAENLRTAHHLCNLRRRDAGPTVTHCPLITPGKRHALRVPTQGRFGRRVRSSTFDHDMLPWLQQRAAADGVSVDAVLRAILRAAMDAECREMAS